MTSAPRGRPWFQLHLGTCVVLMLVAGAFVGANVIKYETPCWEPGLLCVEMLPPSYTQVCRGFPYTYWNAYGPKGPSYEQWYPLALVLDGGIAILAMAAAGFWCEWHSRRRADDEEEFKESIG